MHYYKRVNFKLWKPKWGIFGKVSAPILVLSLTLLISPGYITTESPEEEDITGATVLNVAKPTPTSKQIVYIGIFPIVAETLFAVAEEKGFFREEELDVKVVVFSKREEFIYSFLKGKIHFIGGFDAGDIGVQVALGYPVSIVMEDFWDLKSDKIIIKDKFKDLSELKGKILVCEKNAYADYFYVIKALEKYGLSTNDLKIVDMSDEEAMVAFIKGKVDAIMIAEPLAAIVVEKGNGKVAVVREEIDNDPLAICVRNEVIKENPDWVIKVLKAYFKAVKWSEEHPDEYYKIANRRLFDNTKTHEELKRAQKGTKVLNPVEIKRDMKTNGPLYRYCEEIVDYWCNQGVIDSKPDPSSFINNELYLKAIGAYYE